MDDDVLKATVAFRRRQGAFQVLAAIRRSLPGRAAGWAVALLVLPAAGFAQDLSSCLQGASGSGTTLFTTTCARLPDAFTDLPVTQRVDTFNTRIVGSLEGFDAPVFDETYAFRFADPIVQAGLDAARDAIDLASDDPLDFSGPVRTDAGAMLLSSSIVPPTTVGDPAVSSSVVVETVIGGAGTFARSGDLGRCLGTSSQGYPVDCIGGDPLSIVVLPGNEAFVTHQLFTWTFTREIVTTQTWETFERWDLVGTPRDVVGQVPLPGSLALLGVGLLALALRAGPGSRGRGNAAGRGRRSGRA